MNFITSSFESLAIGLFAGYIYMFLQIRMTRWFGQAVERDIEPLDPRVYRALLMLRLVITAIFLMLVKIFFTPSAQWILTGFLISSVLKTILLIKGLSWI